MHTFTAMPAIKMQSYAAIKREALTILEVNTMLDELRHRGLLREEKCSQSGIQHLLWYGSMDSGNPAHPRSTSVKVSHNTYAAWRMA